MTGWGTGKYNKWHTDDADQQGNFRGRGWGGGQQYKVYCADNGTPVQGWPGGAQYKLECE